MSKPVVEVHIRAIAATSGGYAVFLGNQEKAFVIFVDQSVGAAIAMFMQGTQKEQPLTHDLVANILRALGTKIERVIVNDLKLGTYYARLVLSVENEFKQKKIIEIDARPSLLPACRYYRNVATRRGILRSDGKSRRARRQFKTIGSNQRYFAPCR